MSPVRVEEALACDYAGETAVGLLDALMDAMTLAKPGRDAARLADDLRRLGDGAGFVAQELGGLVAGGVPAAPLNDSDVAPPRRVAAR